MANTETRQPGIKTLGFHSANTPQNVRGAFDEIRRTMKDALKQGGGSVRMSMHLNATSGMSSLEFMRYGAVSGGANVFYENERGIFVISGDVDSLPIPVMRLLRETMEAANEKIHGIEDRQERVQGSVDELLNESRKNGTGLRPSLPVSDDQVSTTAETGASV